MDLPTSDAAPIRFVEDKQPDWRRVGKLMEDSARTGRWANFGPVERRLGDLAARMLDLPDSRTVVPASSATAALNALAGLYAQERGRLLTWAVSAYGFYSTVIGPFGDRVRVVDCDRRGMLDLAALAALPGESWDGAIVTDLFGGQFDLSPYAELCARAGKPLIVDAAVSFPARRSPPIGASEIVSFHHTKPWGFGEGGCAVVDVAQAERVRAYLNFGVGAPRAFPACAANGKMSDIAAALVIQRMESMADWGVSYRRERHRITEIAGAAGLAILVRPPADAVVPHVSVLAPAPIAFADLPPAPFAAAKYYRPLGETCPVAAEIYARIVNVPCHAGMAQVGDGAIRRFMSALADA